MHLLTLQLSGCRNRKNRCDQKLPKCSGCAKSGANCTGFDPLTKREIPRSYIYYLEIRVRNLEALLEINGISYPPPSDDFSIDENIKPGINVPFPPQCEKTASKSAPDSNDDHPAIDPMLQSHTGLSKRESLPESIGMVSVHGASDPRHVSHKNGIPFSRVVFAAVKSSMSQTPSERAEVKPSKQLPSSTASGGGGSFFGLDAKPTIKPASFPDKATGVRLVDLYFEHANPQIPILHRGEFEMLVERVYATDAKKRTHRELYLVNMVFAIGSGIFMTAPQSEAPQAAADSGRDQSEAPNRKRQRLTSSESQPEEFHSAAISHLDSFLGSAAAMDGGGGGLEELQAVLLLAGLALLRPVAPGLWYIIGVAVRLAVDLGLHLEDAEPESDPALSISVPEKANSTSAGRKQWTKDLRRRLWWCVFSFDRLVSSCVGRPFGINDQMTTTSFPSLLDDTYITPTGFLQPPAGEAVPSYKLVARHYFRLRILQSEILQVLQHRQAEQSRDLDRVDDYVRIDLPSPWLQGFDTFSHWRADVDRRLGQWKASAPKQDATGVAFTPLFLELNYWQAIIMLYRQSLAVPEPLAGEMSPSTGESVQSPGAIHAEAKEDEQLVYMKVAQAGQTVLKLYRQLHRLKLVNYTFLATHHLFMSGISFLYAIWDSPLVRSQLTLDDVDFTVYIASSVLTDLIPKCPPAEACRDAFLRMSKATISMCISTTGFGDASTLGTQSLNSPEGYFGQSGMTQVPTPIAQKQRQTTMPKFDMHLRDLFTDDEIASRPLVDPKLQNFGFARSSMPVQGYNQHQGLPLLIPGSQNSSNGIGPPPVAARQSTDLGYQSSPAQPNHQQYAEFDNFQTAQPDFNVDSLLDILPGVDMDQGLWTGADDLSLGFGTGGNGFDVNGVWEDHGGVDLYDGFFFGNGY